MWDDGSYEGERRTLGRVARTFWVSRFGFHHLTFNRKPSLNLLQGWGLSRRLFVEGYIAVYMYTVM